MEDYENDFLQKPKTEKPIIDKRQIDYLKKLKAKLESGVNVRIIPKTKQALKDLFGIDADAFKIKKNKSPLKSINIEDENNVETNENLDEVPIKEEVLSKPSVNDNDKLLLNKLIDEYLFKNLNLMKDPERPGENCQSRRTWHHGGL
jgi:alpha-glucosidase (family GH31 glycosyl hydrolase)